MLILNRTQKENNNNQYELLFPEQLTYKTNISVKVLCPISHNVTHDSEPLLTGFGHGRVDQKKILFFFNSTLSSILVLNRLR